jgi:hypothetical protein
MTSIYAKNAVDNPYNNKYLKVDPKTGIPENNQVPRGILEITASGALPENCPELVVLQGNVALAITVDCSSPNFIGSRVLICKTGAGAHTITFTGLTTNPLSNDTNQITLVADNAANVDVAFIPIVDNGIKSQPIVLNNGLDANNYYTLAAV